jgi:cell wall-associated NlpC family hydrolase
MQAMALLDRNYVYNGKKLHTGFDCSGFVSFVYKESAGVVLRGSAADIAGKTRPVPANTAAPGDLVFFNTMRLTFSHVGIYVGDNKFIHSPSKGTSVRVDDLSSLYWDKRFDGARRLDGSDNLGDAERKELLNEVNKLKRKSCSL